MLEFQQQQLWPGLGRTMIVVIMHSSHKQPRHDKPCGRNLCTAALPSGALNPLSWRSRWPPAASIGKGSGKEIVDNRAPTVLNRQAWLLMLELDQYCMHVAGAPDPACRMSPPMWESSNPTTLNQSQSVSVAYESPKRGVWILFEWCHWPRIGQFVTPCSSLHFR